MINFFSLLVRKHQGQLEFKNILACETRNQSIAKLIQTADLVYSLPDFNWILVNTGDKPVDDIVAGYKTLSFCSDNANYTNIIPDYLFDNWPQVGIHDYEIVRRNLSKLGDIPAQTNHVGWRGALTHPNRALLPDFDDKVNFDVELIEWDRTDPNNLVCTNFVSLEDHAKKWRYLIDVEGNAWSARLKILFFAKRLLFIQDRPYKDYWYDLMKPWVHYVPVARDLSDLQLHLLTIKNNPLLEQEIIQNAYTFALQHLTREAAVRRWADVLTNL